MRPQATERKGRDASRSVKIVVTGPFAAGKTSLIRTISEVAVLSTERDVTDADRVRKRQTTVAMDFGRITIDPELVLYLFGTPGQKRFDFMWQILAEGMLGFVVLVDAQRDDSIAEAADILAFFRDIAQVPYVVGLNKCAALTPADVETVRRRIGAPPSVRVVMCDARDRESVKGLLVELLLAVLDEVEATAAV
ncbi:MAG TPA: ATP/GTP-binding protein [Egibacteraceae bacterium]|jgi:uncharacterized protein|nr:ATP/GTP-binding protein [Egibacteraceae bacterium]